MPKKYLLSICYLNDEDEIFSEPFGLFHSFMEAEKFADCYIDNLRREYCDELNLSNDYIEENFEFDFTIKEVFF